MDLIIVLSTQKRARLEPKAAANQVEASRPPNPTQQSEALTGMNGSSSTHPIQPEKSSSSLLGAKHEAARQELAAGGFTTVAGAKEVSSPGSRESPAAMQKSPGPFGSSNRASGVFGSRPSRQKPSTASTAKGGDHLLPATAVSGLTSSQKALPETASKTAEDTVPTTEKKAGFGVPQAQAFGSARRTADKEQRSPEPAVTQVSEQGLWQEGKEAMLYDVSQLSIFTCNC